MEDDVRPISLTSQLSKVFEGFTFPSLFKQVVGCLNHKQFALACKSTTQGSLDKGEYYVRIFYTDFSKGFDLVDQQALKKDLHRLGVHEALSRWIGAFLVNGTQRVKIDK